MIHCQTDCGSIKIHVPDGYKTNDEPLLCIKLDVSYLKSVSGVV